MCIDFHVKYPLFLSDFNEIELSRQIFLKRLNIEYHENPSSWIQAAPCGQTEGHDEPNSPLFAILQTRQKKKPPEIYSVIPVFFLGGGY